MVHLAAHAPRPTRVLAWWDGGYGRQLLSLLLKHMQAKGAVDFRAVEELVKEACAGNQWIKQ